MEQEVSEMCSRTQDPLTPGQKDARGEAGSGARAGLARGSAREQWWQHRVAHPPPASAHGERFDTCDEKPLTSPTHYYLLLL